MSGSSSSVARDSALAARGPPARPAAPPAGRGSRPAAASSGGHGGAEFAALRAGRGDHQLAARVQPHARRVVERVDRRPRLEVQVASPSRTVPAGAGRTPGCRGCRGPGRPPSPTMNRYFASDSCPCPRMALARVSNSCGLRVAGVGDVRARCRWRAAAGGRRPHRPRGPRARPGITVGITGPVSSWMSSPNVVSSCGGRPTTVNGQIAPGRWYTPVDRHHREVVGEAVVAEVVAERPLGLRARRVDVAGDDEVGVGGSGDGRSPPSGSVAGSRRARTHPQPPAAQRAGERQFGQPLGQRHHRGHGQRRRAADDHVHRQRLAAPPRRRVVDADAAVNLVVQPALAVRLVLVARELHAVHAEVRLHPAGRSGCSVYTCGQRHERPAVQRPALQLRQLRERGLVCEDRPGADELRPQPPRQRTARPSTATGAAERSPGRSSVPPACGRRRARRGTGSGARSRVPNRFDTIGNGVPFTRAKNRAGPPAAIDAALDLGGLQVRVDLLLDADELPGPLQVRDARRKVAIAHDSLTATPAGRGNSACRAGAKSVPATVARCPPGDRLSSASAARSGGFSDSSGWFEPRSRRKFGNGLPSVRPRPNTGRTDTPAHPMSMPMPVPTAHHLSRVALPAAAAALGATRRRDRARGRVSRRGRRPAGGLGACLAAASAARRSTPASCRPPPATPDSLAPGVRGPAAAARIGGRPCPRRGRDHGGRTRGAAGAFGPLRERRLLPDDRLRPRARSSAGRCTSCAARAPTPGPWTPFASALDAGQPLRVELRNYRKDGTEFWVDLSLVPVPDPTGGGRPLGDDPARHHRPQARPLDALRRSEELFRGIFENAAAGVSLTDRERAVRVVQPGVRGDARADRRGGAAA